MAIIASASDELKFHQWLEGDLKLNYTPPNHTQGPIKTISWGKDGNWIVIVPSSGLAEVISIKQNIKVLKSIHNVSHPTSAAFQNLTKRNIAIGTLSGQVLVYDIKLGNVKKRFPRATSSIFNLKYNSRDSHIVAACANGDILLYNYLTTNLSSMYKVPKSVSVSAVAFHRSKRNLLGAGSKEGVIATWDINTNQVLSEITAHQAAVTDIAFSPIRNDFIITGGLDRRFAYYDLTTKRCIIEVEVSSSTTSLDFSPCGTFLGLGSQNGNIIVYDTRNFRKPISAFVGHEGKRIHHLVFQKVISCDSDSGDSSFDVPVMEESPNRCESESIGESLGLITCDVSNAQDSHKTPQLEDDSFLAILGLNNVTDVSEACVNQDNSTTSRIVEDETLNESKRSIRLELPEMISTKTPITNSKQISSTPNMFNENMPASTVSPIIAPPPTRPTCDHNMDEFKQIIKDSIKEEIQSQMGSFNEVIKTEFWDSHGQIRRHFLDLHMLIIRQFVEMETKVNAISNATVREFVCDEFLIRRNEELLREVELLRHQLAEVNQIRRNF